MQWSTVRIMKRRELIFRHGDPAKAVILVLEGYVKLSTTVADGREVVLEIIGPGEYVGEVVVLNTWSHDVEATTLSRCRLLVIDGRQFRQLLERSPEGMLAIMRLVSERLQRASEKVVDALGLAASARLAKALIHLARLQLSSPSYGDSAWLCVSQSELGAMTGLTRESVNKFLHTWCNAGWIRLAGGSITLIDSAAFSSLLSAEAQGIQPTTVDHYQRHDNMTATY
jgi:CRP-like cAMP-binding protein